MMGSLGTLKDFQCEKMFVECIKEHFKAKKCPSDQCAELWLVSTYSQLAICINITMTNCVPHVL